MFLAKVSKAEESGRDCCGHTTANLISHYDVMIVDKGHGIAHHQQNLRMVVGRYMS